MEIKDRIIQYIAHKRVKVAEFERRSGLSNGYINNLKSTPGADKLERILTVYPDLNRSWLMTGEGDMLNTTGSVYYDSQGRRNVVGESSLGYMASAIGDKEAIKEALYALSQSNKLLSRHLEECTEQNKKLLDIIQEMSSSKDKSE